MRAKFIALIVAGLTVLFAAIATYTIRITTENLRKSLVNESKSFAAFATKPIGDTFVLYKDSGTIRIEQQIDKFADLNNSINDIKIVDIEGKKQFHRGSENGFDPTPEQSSSFEVVYAYDGADLTHIIYPYIEDFGAHRYSIVYTVSYDAIDASIRQLTTGIVILATAALAASILVSYFVINKFFLKPLGLVSRAAINISRGNLGLKVESPNNDEIGDLAKSVNTMADALKADINKLKEVDAMKSEFMMIASHNLRTPLTAIQGYLDNLLSTGQLSPEVRETLQVVAASGNRLNTFAEDILTVSRLEAGEKLMGERSPADLNKLLDSVAKDFTALAKEKKLVFSADLGVNACMVVMSAPHVRAAIWNLLDNALKFTKQGTINLRLQTEAQYARITISDTGAGISPEEIPKLFTKFHRGTSTMEYNYEGTGIGLYITKLIIEQHGGIIKVDSKLGTGTTVTLRLPLTPSSV